MAFYKNCDDPLVTVIIPVYNVGDYIQACVESVIRQTYSNLEIILIDDGSKDLSGEICDGFEDERVCVIHQLNQGLSAARNAGIEASHGEILAFVDGDDTISKGMIESMVTAMKRSGAEIVCCGYTRNEDVLENSIITGGRWIEQKEAISHYLDHYGYRMMTWNKIYKRELFDKVRFPNGEYYEDVKVTYQLFNRIAGIYYIDKPMYCYRERENSIVEEDFSKRSFDRLKSINYVMRDCRNYDKGVFNNLIPGYAANYLSFINCTIRGGKKFGQIERKLSQFLKHKMFRIMTYDGICFPVRLGIMIYFISPVLYRKYYSFYNRRLKKGDIVSG